MTNALVPSSFAELLEMSETIAGAEGLVPRHVRTPRHAAVLIMRGAELGLKPMESLGGLHLIEGRVTLSADTMLRVAIAGGVRVSYPDFTPERVTVELTRAGWETSFRCTWDLEMARRAGLAGRQNWKKFPRAMLRARAVAEAVRAYCPDLLSGTYLPEELPPERIEVAPAPGPAPAPPEEETIEDAEVVEPEPEQGSPIGDREYLEILFGEQLEAALTSKTITERASPAAQQIGGWLDEDRDRALSDLHRASWDLIMPATLDGEQARKMVRRLRTEDGQRGLRREIYKRLPLIVERVHETTTTTEDRPCQTTSSKQRLKRP